MSPLSKAIFWSAMTVVGSAIAAIAAVAGTSANANYSNSLTDD